MAQQQQHISSSSSNLCCHFCCCNFNLNFNPNTNNNSADSAANVSNLSTSVVCGTSISEPQSLNESTNQSTGSTKAHNTSSFKHTPLLNQVLTKTSNLLNHHIDANSSISLSTPPQLIVTNNNINFAPPQKKVMSEQF
jgi:hypothetical protein